jgi:hypothetical protein
MAPCILCNNFERKRRDFHVAFDCEPGHLDLAVQAGCRICSLLREGIAKFEPKFGGIIGIRRVYVWGPTVDQPKEGTVEVELYLQDFAKLRLEFFFAGDGK